MGSSRPAVFVFAFALAGCATVFRDSKATVHVESSPQGAEIKNQVRSLGRTPAQITVDRGGTTSLKLEKPGYKDRWGSVGKSLNAGWVVADVATCVIPVALCIPLLVDALSGAWNDVDEVYRATLEPGGPTPPPSAAPATPPGLGAPPGAPSATPSGAPPVAPPVPTPQPGDIRI